MRSFVLPVAVVFVSLLSGPSSAQMGRGVDRHTQDAQCVSRYNGSPSGRNCQMPTGHLCSTEGLLSTGACFHDGIWEPLADLQPLDLSEEDEAEENAEQSEGPDEPAEASGEGGEDSAEITESSDGTTESAQAESADSGTGSDAGGAE
jgi:hypothetical protein